MPVIKDQELLYTLLSEGRLDLMFLPANAITWLWKDERPEEQVIAATQLGVAAKDINPIIDASVLKADKNILILKCEDGQTFRVYPGGGYSHGGEEMMDLNGAIEAMQDIPDGEMQDPEVDMPCGNDMMDVVTGIIDVAVPQDDGFDHMAAPQPPEEAMMGGPVKLKDLLRRGTEVDMDEEYGDQPRYSEFYTYDELSSLTARDIQAHTGEDMDELEDENIENGCSQNVEGQEVCNDGGLPNNDSQRLKKFNFSDDDDNYITRENAGGAAASSAPAGSDVFDSEDDIASGVVMQFEAED